LLIRDGLMKEAGAVTYDLIDREFRSLARRLDWPKEATIKDFRHLFSTTMENAGMPEFYRKHLMGHSLGRAAIVNYTHLNKVHELYEDAVRMEWPALLEAFEGRAGALGLASPAEPRSPASRLRIVKRAR
jgi:integrase